jgi:hypothetical protein
MQYKMITDKRITLIGSAPKIAETSLLLNDISSLAQLQEPAARRAIQQCIDTHNIRTIIMFDGNTVWHKKRILADIRRVKTRGMLSLTDYLYNFLSLSCGSIAHFNRLGWIATYPSIDHLRRFFRRNEYGQRVLDYIPLWKTDARVIVEEIEKILEI